MRRRRRRNRRRTRRREEEIKKWRVQILILPFSWNIHVYTYFKPTIN